jgi:L-iditol 2-dehydrogenase
METERAMPETMKAAFYLGPGNFEVRETPKPEATDGEVLLKVDACSVCGTDIRIFKSGHPKVTPPHITGHEICGVIQQVGKGVQGLKEGQRVTVVTEVGCGQCDFCRRGKQNLCYAVSQELNAVGYKFQGGFAEYMPMVEAAVTQGCVLPVPDHLSNEEVCLIEPLSCVINGQEYLNITIGDTVAVFGAGPIGSMHIALARAKGASKIFLIEPMAERQKMAERFGPDAIIDPNDGDPVQQILDLTNGNGVSVAITACSVGVAQEQAVAMAAIQGRVCFFGGLPKDKPTINLNSNTVHYKELSLFGAFASAGYQYSQALNLLATGQIDGKKFITHKFPLEQVVEGIQTSMRGEALKVAIEP